MLINKELASTVGNTPDSGGVTALHNRWVGAQVWRDDVIVLEVYQHGRHHFLPHSLRQRAGAKRVGGRLIHCHSK